MAAFIVVLMLHGVLAGIDVVLNHELLARLPRHAGAAMEQTLHALREAVFAVLFAGLAWLEWHGALAWIVAALLAAELVIAAIDVKIEIDIRVLPAPERILHLLLFINFGAILVLLGERLLAWRTMPTGFVAVDHGWASWALTALAIAALGWALRDGRAAWRLAAARQRPTG